MLAAGGGCTLLTQVSQLLLPAPTTMFLNRALDQHSMGVISRICKQHKQQRQAA